MVLGADVGTIGSRRAHAAKQIVGAGYVLGPQMAGWKALGLSLVLVVSACGDVAEPTATSDLPDDHNRDSPTPDNGTA